MSKMKTLATLGAATAVAALMATGASALTWGTISSGAGGNDAIVPLGLGNSLGGIFGANLYLTGNSDILVEYLGAEASFVNSFTFGTFSAATPGVAAWNTSTNASATLSNTAAGLLSFSFLTGGGYTVNNGSNADGGVAGAEPNFFVSFADPTQSSGQMVYLFLDDSQQGDDNHDDMVIRLTATGGSFVAPIPVPAAGLLLLGGLGALGAFARRRNRKAA